MLSLTPVVEVTRSDIAFEWAQLDAPFEWIALGPDCSDNDVALVVATLAVYNRIASSGSIADVVRAIEAAGGLVLPGGLRARVGDFEIEPSCCCGLEGWREWQTLKPGAHSPWLGHDPSPWIECKSDAAVLWAGEAKQSPNVAVSYAEIDNAVAAAHAALLGFSARLAAWVERHAPAQQGLTQRFNEAFRIGQ